MWATLRDDGSLVISGQDFNGFAGTDEYEYALTIAAVDVLRLAAALSVEPADVLAGLEARGEAIVQAGERSWLEGIGITPEFWSRFG